MPSYILGINDGHSATAALMKDGKILTSVSEERFTKKKNQFGFPVKAVEYSLKHAGINGSDLDLVVISWKNPFQISIYQTLMEGQSTNSLDLPGRYQEWFKEKIIRRWPNAAYFHETMRKRYEKMNYNRLNGQRLDTISKHLGITKDKILLADHHMCHAHYAYYANYQRKSPTLVFTLDGQGDDSCAMVSTIKDESFEPIAITPRWRSVGEIYQHITKYMGMKPLEHEYKVMGLAPYASPDATERAYRVMEKFAIVKDDLTFETDVSSWALEGHLERTLKGQRFDGIAGAVQKLVETRVTEWIRAAVKRTGITDVAFAGGVFLNVKLNMLIASMPELTSIYFAPSPGDESNGMGACYFGYKHLGNTNPEPVKDLYLGPSFTDEEIERALKTKGCYDRYEIEQHDDVDGTLADLLAKNKIVARFAGRMEWGARSLGNRAILSNASHVDNMRTINDAIKMRDFWMPFAPTILKSRENDYIENERGLPAPYMILAFMSRPLAKKEIVAAIHPYDYTCRPQSLEDGWNHGYERVL
ncbi:carbamoyltransferase N-terminal domain-containing protein, partial [Nitrososphaera sp.]|uniref:carbamoyltransferase N-terminal domain-containing protein n=1 Tax=Nitrososphaera sp. TaxID=1971748 RepID=UPI00316D4B78